MEKDGGGRVNKEVEKNTEVDMGDGEVRNKNNLEKLLGKAGSKAFEILSAEKVQGIIPDNILLADCGLKGFKQQEKCKKKCEYLMAKIPRPSLSDFDPRKQGRYGGTRPVGKLINDYEKLASRQARFDEDPDDPAYFWDKALEVLPYAMIEYGSFADDDGRKAEPFYLSDFEDVLAGVDLAMSVPITYEKDGKTMKTRIPMAFDVTSASSDKAIAGKFAKRRNDTYQYMPEPSAQIRYGVNKDFKVLGGWKKGEELKDPEMLRFIIGVDRIKMMKLLETDNITKEKERAQIEYIIARQIAEQSYTMMQMYTLKSREAKALGEDISKKDHILWSQATHLNKKFSELCVRLKGPDFMGKSIGSADDAQQKILLRTRENRKKLQGELMKQYEKPATRPAQKRPIVA
ncbi:MAG: hypothetical protein Q4E47_01470 [Candidatus Saccharibacteria bacterium]|nr:hypothetical protein [Candidatus Saccharibacteria bacterium]